MPSDTQPKEGNTKKGLKNPPGEGEQEGNQELFHYDSYWLKYVKEVIDGTLPNINRHIKSYSTFLDGLSFTTFLGGVALGIYFKSANLKVFALIVGPIIFLQFAKYFLKVKIGAPTITEIQDPQNPEKIHDAYNTFVRDAHQKLKTGGIIVGLATLVYLICIPIGIFEHNSLKAPDFDQYTHIEIQDKVIKVRALLPNAAYATLSISGKNSDGEVLAPKILNLLIDEQFKLESTVALTDFDIIPEQVTLYYQVDDQIKSYVFKQAKTTKVMLGVNPGTKADTTDKLANQRYNKAKDEKQEPDTDSTATR